MSCIYRMSVFLSLMTELIIIIIKEITKSLTLSFRSLTLPSVKGKCSLYKLMKLWKSL